MSAYRYRDPARDTGERWRSTLITPLEDIEGDTHWRDYEAKNAKCNAAYREQDWRQPVGKVFGPNSRSLAFAPQAEAIVTEWIRLGRPDPPPFGSQPW
jgi:hypothetical protein